MSKNKGRIRISVRQKIMIFLCIAITAMGVAYGVQTVMFSRYISQYNGVLDSITLVNALSGELDTRLSDEVYSMAIGKKTVEDGEHHKLVDAIQDRLQQLEKGEHDEQVLSGLDSLRRITQGLEEQMVVFEQALATGSSYDDSLKTVDTVEEIMALMREETQNTLYWKLKDSQQLQQQVSTAFRSNTSITMTLFVILLLVMLLGGWLLSTRMSTAIKQLSSKASLAASGDLTGDAVTGGSRDEIGTLSQSFNNMFDHLKSVIIRVRDANQQAAHVTSDISSHATNNRRAGADIVKASQEIAVALAEQFEAVHGAAQDMQHMTQAVEGLRSNSERISRSSDQALDMAKNGTAYSDELMQGIQRVSQSFEQASAQTERLSTLAGEMLEMSREIRRLSVTTGILALNVGIAAARSKDGEQSFKVLAGEINQLARQSQRLASHIEEHTGAAGLLVSDVQRQMKESEHKLHQASGKAKDTRDYFYAIVQSNVAIHGELGTIHDQISGISLGLQEFQGVIHRLEGRSDQIRMEAHTIHSMVQEQSVSLEGMLSSSDHLMYAVRGMADEVNRFEV